MEPIDYSAILIPAFEALKQSLYQMFIAVLPYAIGIFGLKFGLVLVVKFFKGLLTSDDDFGAPVWNDFDSAEWDSEEAHEDYYRVADGMDMGGDDPEDYSSYMHDNHDY